MYQLTRISLINWYLVSARDVEIRDATAFIGPTGAGKTSILDAIQTVICGGSHRHVHPNASASGKSDRKIIDYCLGYLVPKADGGEPLRTDCESILALTFGEERFDGTRHDIAVGLAMTARQEDSREVILTRFIAPGHAFSVERWKDVDEEGSYIRRWEEIERELKRICPEMRPYRHGAERFVADMLAVMRPRGKQPDARHVLQAFSNAVTFKPIFDPTQFCRAYILEPDPLEVERVRESIARWREMVATIQTIEEKLKRLRSVRQRYAQWGEALIGRASDLWGRGCARVEIDRLGLRKAGRALEAVRSRRNNEEALQKAQGRALEEAEQELKQKQATLAAAGLQDRLGRIGLERELALKDLKPLETQAASVREVLQLAANLREARPFISGSAWSIVQAASEALARLQWTPGLDWLPRHGRDVAACLARVVTLAALPETLDPQIAHQLTELGRLRGERDAARDNLARLASGATPLSRHTQAFRRLLGEAGIEATPLCDVVEITDESWQFAVEALLGNGREALIVDPVRVGEANELLYRNRNQAGLHNCRLVKTTRTHTVRTQVDRDSLAAVVRSDDPHALAYVATHLGGFRMVDGEAELERADRAVMRNGKTTSGLAYSVQRDLALIIGRRAREETAEALRRIVDDLAGQIADLTRDLKLLEGARRVADRLATFQVDVEEIALRHDEIRRTLEELDRRQQSVLSEEEARLVAEIEGLKTEISEYKAELRQIDEALKSAIQEVGRAESEHGSARRALKASVTVKRQAAANFADSELEGVLEWADAETRSGVLGAVNPCLAQRLQLADDGRKAIAVFEEQYRIHDAALHNIDTRVARLANSARTGFDDYLRDYGIERPITDQQPFTADYAWVVRYQIRLEQNELRAYREQAERAEKEMYFTLKEDLLAKLNSKFQKLDIQLRTLNQQLKRHRFTGQFYKFRKKPDPAYDRIRRLAIEVGSNPEQAQAIVEGRAGDLALQAAMSELNEYLEHTGGSGLEDYRNYFTYDLVMFPPEAQDDDSPEIQDEDFKRKGLISLSARATVASGGEGEAPFYVAIAASLTLAYYPGGHPGATPSGMGLVLFDEAFKKLDIPNTQSLIRFFKDLGLQIVLAAPEDKRPTFTEVLDCIVAVNKDPVHQVVHLDSEFPTPYAREQMGAINPEHVGIEGYRRRLTEGVDA
ncbi:hypothetical protein FFK22_016670 [Mycobacterium sp. KBS0706]|uniref:ATP-binding protein n=1 Tax=Mycobacterium sp. KBS0706 TaxID=2578109 RepID=UPI00110FA263|nr:SbcC/MukB-like Walker B domain-containing protein [Mycobacterium sp. KBS0706]TSD87617.1 hypothetical protein FFK22_016670 [Mycobacterium sp. KBS0706]